MTSLILLLLTFYFILLTTCVSSKQTDDDDYLKNYLNNYLEQPEQEYAWHHTNVTFQTIQGGTAHVLNITSLKWYNESTYTIVGGGPVWTHEVVVVVPKVLKYKNVSTLWLGAKPRCNNLPPIKGINLDIGLIDIMASNLESIVIVAYQIPNCPMIYESDPSKTPRDEDPQLAWSFKNYFDDPNLDPLNIAVLPMVKACFQIMRATNEFLSSKNLAKPEGWFVTGASKRGWTTWIVGASSCSTCAKIIGIAPLVPIVPNMRKIMHRQWMAYEGFSFAFYDYIEAGMIKKIDSDDFTKALKVIDPVYFLDRLENLPKLIIVSSNDEFMMFDWTNIWWDQMVQEKHLYIVPNSDHPLITQIPKVVASIEVFFRSIIQNKTRPDFQYKYDNSTGQLQVIIPQGLKPSSVQLHYAETLQQTRRDFRWIRQANNQTGTCSLPCVPTPVDILRGNCLQPMFWWSKTLQENEPGIYKVLPPEPKKGYWSGYYIKVSFPGNTESGQWFLGNSFEFTTPGYTWPNTLPFEDCFEDTCVGKIV